jgi:rfaE bifunctional protein kinase chain/domain
VEVDVNPAEILSQFPALRVLVAGDICLDRWCRYDPALALPSAETGIPRIAVVRTEVTPGAGGTVANNLAAMGVGTVSVLGVTGNDGFAWELRDALAQRGIDSSLLLTLPGVPTFTYTKLINSVTEREDLPRVDFVQTRALDDDIEMRIVRALLDSAPNYDVIMVSDQAESTAGGVITAAVRGAVASIASASPEKVVWVDSREHVELFQGVITKPNRKEAEEASLRVLGRIDFRRLRSHVGAPLMFVTQGDGGVRVYDTHGEVWIRTAPVENPVDICGAGDSFSAGAACAYAVTRDPRAAAEFGNRVASVTIMKRGTGTASPAEIMGQR